MMNRFLYRSGENGRKMIKKSMKQCLESLDQFSFRYSVWKKTNSQFSLKKKEMMNFPSNLRGKVVFLKK